MTREPAKQDTGHLEYVQVDGDGGDYEIDIFDTVTGERIHFSAAEWDAIVRDTGYVRRGEVK